MSGTRAGTVSVKHPCHERRLVWILWLILTGFLMTTTSSWSAETSSGDTWIPLPVPRLDSQVSVEQALHSRRSVRSYRNNQLTLAEVGQLLWAGQGVTGRGGLRTAPSAGALYPLETYLVAGDVAGLNSGIYKYNPHGHNLRRVVRGDLRGALRGAAWGQGSVGKAPAVLILAAVYERTARKYGKRSQRYVFMEAGHAAQNIYLQAVSLGLATVAIGAFSDRDVKEVADLADDEEPLYLLPVGRIE